MYHIDEVRWDITKRCNLRCKHCYVGPSLTSVRDPDFLDTETSLKLVDKLAKDGVKRIQFLGGEPFARPDFLTILERVAGYGISILVSTNGTVLSDRAANLFGTFPKWSVTFSLDGPSAETNDPIRGRGVFKRTCRGIERLVKNKTQQHPKQTVAINCVLHRKNIDHLDEMLGLAASLGVDVLQFNSMDDQGFADTKGTAKEAGVAPSELLDAAVYITRRSAGATFEVRQVYLQPIGRKYIAQTLGIPIDLPYGGCKAGVRGAFINEKGLLFSCSELTYGRYPDRGNDFAKPLDAFTPFDEAMAAAPFQAMQQLRKERVHEREYQPCSSCEYKGLCHPCSLPSLKGAKINLALCGEAHHRLGSAANSYANGNGAPATSAPLRFVPRSEINGSITEGLCK